MSLSIESSSQSEITFATVPSPSSTEQISSGHDKMDGVIGSKSCSAWFQSMTTKKGFIVVFPPLTLILKYCHSSPVLFTTTKEYKPAADLSICEKKKRIWSKPRLENQGKEKPGEGELGAWLDLAGAAGHWVGFSLLDRSPSVAPPRGTNIHLKRQGWGKRKMKNGERWRKTFI